jgi:hypothetical protein
VSSGAVCGLTARKGAQMARSLTALAATAVVALLAVTGASGGKPVREPLFIESFELPNTCPFPVFIDITANKEFVTLFDDGRLHVTGKLFATVTNMNSGESLELNISGPAVITADSERIFGRGLFFLFPEDAGGPGLILTTGRVDVIRAADGSVDELTVRGQRVDVCAELAD